MGRRLSVLLVLALVTVTGCQTGASMWGSCSPTQKGDVTGTDGTYVLVCQDGKWMPIMTTGEFVQRSQGDNVPIKTLPTEPKPKPKPTTTTTVPPAPFVWPSETVAGNNVVCELQDGSVSCRGAVRYGQLGPSVTEDSATLVAIPGLTDIVDISAGHSSVCAVRKGGEVLCWGETLGGQFGDQSIDPSPTPRAVDLPAAATQVAVSGPSACAVTVDRKLVCWGEMLGEETTYAPRLLPFDGAVAQVDVGSEFVCMLSAAGEVWCSGWEYEGTLGNGESDSNERGLVKAIGLPPIEQITSGETHTCAVSASGDVYCWGLNEHGVTGSTGGDIQSVPTLVDGLSGVTNIDAAGLHTCATDADGVACWGVGTSGQLQHGGTASSSAPLPAELESGGVVADLALGTLFSCVRFADGSDECWGDNRHGQLGETPPVWDDVAMVDNQLAVGGQYGCVIRGGDVFCWGARDDDMVPTAPLQVSTIENAIAIDSEGSTTCAVDADGKLWCWNDYTTDSPVEIDQLAGAVDLAMGRSHECVLAATGEVYCRGFDGRLGNGTNASSATLVQVSGIDSAVDIVAGQAHTCALLEDETVWCWGDNSDGQLGSDILEDSLVPLLVEGLAPVSALDASEVGTCAITDDETVRCWGEPYEWPPVETTFSDPGVSGAQRIGLGMFSGCTLTSNGAADCWGVGLFGSKGDGARSWLPQPARVAAPEPFVAIDSSFYRSCALGLSGALYCWGLNDNGQLGTGDEVDTAVPVPIF